MELPLVTFKCITHKLSGFSACVVTVHRLHLTKLFGLDIGQLVADRCLAVRAEAAKLAHMSLARPFVLLQIFQAIRLLEDIHHYRTGLLRRLILTALCQFFIADFGVACQSACTADCACTAYCSQILLFRQLFLAFLDNHFGCKWINLFVWPSAQPSSLQFLALYPTQVRKH